jgi:NAD(P)-dependent dehydrogenase (short-subunit alcohol dehydrogenase family)
VTDLGGRVALVTGAKRIGAALARALGERGCDVAVTYQRSREEAEQAASEVRASGARAHVVQADLSRPPDCEAVVASTVDALGGLDILVNMASVYAEVPFEQTDDRIWNRVVDVDLRASFLCARAAVAHMRARGGGRIVNFADWLAASRRPRYRGYVPYYVAKSGVIALTEALALELAADRILVNAIAPGPIVPPPGTSDEELKSVEAATPLGRWGGEQAIVTAVMFLVDTDFVTGETIRVDGGRHVR